MAKKATSSTKKAVKKTVPAKAKAPAKKTVKPAAKSVAKAAVKPVAKTAKAAPVKASKKETPKVATPAKVKPKPVPAKEVAKAKPSVMNKKVVEPDVEDEAVEETEDSGDDVAVGKAEKNSKIKPIRIEKGNSADEKAKWVELSKKYGKDKAVPYKMSDTFQALTPIQHKVLGWGFILSNDNDRLEVLFETGIRMLISNYKS